ENTGESVGQDANGVPIGVPHLTVEGASFGTEGVSSPSCCGCIRRGVPSSTTEQTPPRSATNTPRGLTHPDRPNRLEGCHAVYAGTPHSPRWPWPCERVRASRRGHRGTHPRRHHRRSHQPPLNTTKNAPGPPK